MYVYFDSVVHYTCYVNNVRQIKPIQIHPEPRPTPKSLEDCGWVLKRFPTRVGPEKRKEKKRKEKRKAENSFLIIFLILTIMFRFR